MRCAGRSRQAAAARRGGLTLSAWACSIGAAASGVSTATLAGTAAGGQGQARERRGGEGRPGSQRQQRAQPQPAANSPGVLHKDTELEDGMVGCVWGEGGVGLCAGGRAAGS